MELGKKIGDSDKYVILNNFVTKQNAIGIFNDELDTVTDQYTELMEYEGNIYLAVTQGKGKERIMFGLLENRTE